MPYPGRVYVSMDESPSKLNEIFGQMNSRWDSHFDYDCDDIRKRILQHTKIEKKQSLKSLLDELGHINSNTYTKFMSRKGAREGATLNIYPAAVKFFQELDGHVPDTTRPKSPAARILESNAKQPNELYRLIVDYEHDMEQFNKHSHIPSSSSVPPSSTISSSSASSSLSSGESSTPSIPVSTTSSSSSSSSSTPSSPPRPRPRPRSRSSSSSSSAPKSKASKASISSLESEMDSISDSELPPRKSMPTCNTIRKKIQEFLVTSGWTQTEFLRYNGVNSNSFRKFMSYRGNFQGIDNGMYEKGVIFFDKLSVIQKNKKKQEKQNPTKKIQKKRKSKDDDDDDDEQEEEEEEEEAVIMSEESEADDAKEAKSEKPKKKRRRRRSKESDFDEYEHAADQDEEGAPGADLDGDGWQQDWDSDDN